MARAAAVFNIIKGSRAAGVDCAVLHKYNSELLPTIHTINYYDRVGVCY